MENLPIDLDREIASTRRLLERYPLGKGEWQPHDKSRTLSALATHIANIPHHRANILTTAEMALRPSSRHTAMRSTSNWFCGKAHGSASRRGRSSF
jgi:hypothetical protein